MNYYLIAPITLGLPPLTYQCESHCEKFDICEISVRKIQYLGVVLESIAKPDFKCENATRLEHYFSPFQHKMAQFIAQYYCVGYGEAYTVLTGKYIESIKNIHSPKNPRKKHITESLESTPQTPTKEINLKHLEIHSNALKTLTIEQEKALNFIKDNPNVLLFGDTGSGKTEIYIHLIAKAIKEEKSALFLMPEIALTPQIEKRLKAVFGDLVGIWHSQITQKNKKNILQKIHNKQIRIIAGARSALFLPLFDLGLIIVDEEHDDAYKCQNIPHYNARDVALYLGQKSDIKVLLGSATPSLTSYFHAKTNSRLFRLKGRHFGSQKQIHFLPLADEINEEIIENMRLSLEKNEQIIVFLPTRAHYKMLVCAECGKGVECAFCSVNMSLHLDKNALICHYCHWHKPIPKICPNCAKEALHSHRIGTAEVAKILSHRLENAKIELFDRDNITTHKKLKDILTRFNDGEISVLVGTQMLSKGHDYHQVNLAIVLGIDYVLRAQDFRANERAISLLHQIAGRAGRKNDGKVYIQTANGAFLQGFMGDYEKFLKSELESRPRIYPPFMRLCAINIAHKDESKALNALQAVREILESLRESVEIVGDSRALLAKLYGKHRFMILLRSHSTNALLKILGQLNARADKHLRSCYEIDIDPINMI